MQWMLLPFRRYAEFRGRSRRKEFWMFQLLNIMVAGVLFLSAILVAPSARSSRFDSGEGGFAASADFQADIAASPLATALVAIYAGYALAAFIPSIAVTVRRFHDQDKSGWWYLGLLLGSLVPLLGIVPAIALLVFMAVPGTPGVNRFGSDPKDPYGEEVFA